MERDFSKVELWEFVMVFLYELVKRSGGNIVFYVALAATSYLLFRAKIKIRSMNSLLLSRIWILRKRKKIKYENPIIIFISELMISVSRNDYGISSLYKRRFFKTLIEKDIGLDTIYFEGISHYIVSNWKTITVPKLRGYISDSFDSHVSDTEEIIYTTLEDIIPNSAIDYFLEKRQKLKTDNMNKLIFELKLDQRVSVELIYREYLEKFKDLYRSYVTSISALWEEANGELAGNPVYIKFHGRLIKTYPFGRVMFDEENGIVVCEWNKIPFNLQPALAEDLLNYRDLFDAKKWLAIITYYGHMPPEIVKLWGNWALEISNRGLKYLVNSYPFEAFARKTINQVTDLQNQNGLITRTTTAEEGLSWLMQAERIYENKSTD